MRADLDRRLWSSRTRFCGVDEVGRGALAGPVVAAAVIMPPGSEIRGIDDSKRLTPRRRESLSRSIRECALSWAFGLSGPRVIDRKNILVATFRAMQRAIAGLRVRPELVLADGWPIPGLGIPCTGIVGGDRQSYTIACASILAKVHRDRMMAALESKFPGYGLAKHKGYPTAEHIDALRRLGPSPIHRRTFGPVRGLAE